MAASSASIQEVQIVGALAATTDSPFFSYDTFNAKASWERAHGIRSLSDDEESSSDEEMPMNNDRKRDLFEWEDTSTELLPKDKFEGTKVQYIIHFCNHMMKLWDLNPTTKDEDAKLAFGGTCCKIDYNNVLKTVKNLCEDLKTGKISTAMVKQIHGWVCAIVDRQYVAATQTYCDITIGKTKWHQDVQVGEARHNKGYNSRKIHRKAGTDFAENLSQNQADNKGVEAYMLCMKRLQTKAEELRPEQR